MSFRCAAKFDDKRDTILARIVSRLSSNLAAHLKDMSLENAQMPFVFAQCCEGSFAVDAKQTADLARYFQAAAMRR